MWENWSSETWIHLCWVVYLGSWVLSDRQTPSYQGREMNIEDMEARLCECRLYDRNKAMRFKTKFSGEKNRWRIKKATSARPHPQIVNILSFFIYLALLSQLFILSLNLGDLQDSAFISSLYFLPQGDYHSTATSVQTIPRLMPLALTCLKSSGHTFPKGKTLARIL